MTSFNANVDPEVYIAIQRGILAGIGILTFFVFFPGEPFDFQQDTKQQQHENEQFRDGDGSEEKVSSSAAETGTETKDGQGQGQSQSEVKQNSKMRAQTQGQSQRVEQVSPTTQASKQLDSHVYTDWIWILNWIVYIATAFGIMHVLKLSYGIDFRSHFILFFKYYFPREAAVLHL